MRNFRIVGVVTAFIAVVWTALWWQRLSAEIDPKNVPECRSKPQAKRNDSACTITELSQADEDSLTCNAKSESVVWCPSDNGAQAVRLSQLVQSPVDTASRPQPNPITRGPDTMSRSEMKRQPVVADENMPFILPVVKDQNPPTPDDGIHATGLDIPNTLEEIERQRKIDARMETVQAVGLNKIGLARINQERVRQGQPPLVAGKDAIVYPIGEEVISCRETSASATPILHAKMDLDMEMKVDNHEVMISDEIEVTIPKTDGASSAFSLGLPAVVDNSKLKYFPPIRSQGSMGSCAQWAAIYYTMTHMTALMRDWDAKNGGDEFRFSPLFTYNLLNQGDGKNGTSFGYGENIAMEHGVVRWSEFPYRNDPKIWDTTPEHYRHALGCRLQKCLSLKYVNTEEGFSRLQELLNNGYVVYFATYVNSWVWKTISDDPSTSTDDSAVGEKIVHSVSGINGGHGMTIVGYDNNIWLDVDADGQVDVGEKGAFKIANSWGGGWDGDGYCWVSYHAVREEGAYPVFGGNQVRYVLPRTSYQPKLIAKATFRYPYRGEVRLRCESTTTDQTSFVYSHSQHAPLFTRAPYGGGEYAFDGSNVPCDFTCYFDFTDWIERGVRRRYMFGMGEWLTYTKTGDGVQGTIKNFELYRVSGESDIQVGISPQIPVTVDSNHYMFDYDCAWVDYTYTDEEENKAPVAQSSSITLSEDESAPVTLVASDSNGDALSYVIVKGPDHGVLSGVAPYFTYTPTADYHGADSFAFRVNDGHLNSNDAVVNIAIKPVNDTPEIESIYADPSEIKLSDTTNLYVLSNDRDGDSVVITWRKISGPGEVIFTPNGTVTSDECIARFSMAGTYVLEASLSDGIESCVGTVVVEVHSVPAPLTGLAAYYTLNEWTGRVASDSSENGHHGTVKGDPVWTPKKGKIGGALKLLQTTDNGGMFDHVECNSYVGSSSALTVAFWMKTDHCANQIPIDKFPNDNTGHGWTIKARPNGELWFRVGSLGNYHDLKVSNAYVAGRWVHVACTFVDGCAKIYIDGIERGVANGVEQNPANVTTPLWLGSASRVAISERLNGYLDDVRIYHEALDSESIRKLVYPPIPFGECGQLTSSQSGSSQWHVVSFSRTYVEPVVGVMMQTYNGTDPSTVRIRNVTSNGFEYQVEEYDYLKPSGHASETIGYLVVEAGCHELDGRTIIQAGRTNLTDYMQKLSFPVVFPTSPVVISQVASTRDSRTCVTRQSSVSNNGLNICLQSQEAGGQAHEAEVVHWIAMEAEAGKTGNRNYTALKTKDCIASSFKRIELEEDFASPPVVLASMQTTDGPDTAALRCRNVSGRGFEVSVEEECSADEETNHTSEVVGAIVLEPGPILGNKYWQGDTNE